MIDSCFADRSWSERRWLLAAAAALVVTLALATLPAAALGGTSAGDATVITPEPCELPSTLNDKSVCVPPACDDGYVLADEICVPQPEPPVEKTAYTKWVRWIDWDINKQLQIKGDEYADQQRWKIFWGDSVYARYVIGLEKKVKNKYSVHGKIAIPLAPYADGLARGPIHIKDVITLESGKEIEVPHKNIRCDGHDAVPQTLDYRGTLVCHYWVYLDKPEAGINRVWVWTGNEKAARKAEAKFAFADAPTDVHGHKEVWIRDNNFPDQPVRGPFDGSQTRYPYKKHFECNRKHNPYWHTNVAQLLVPAVKPVADAAVDAASHGYRVIAEDRARVQIECFGLKVKKNAKTKFKRQFEWKIRKRASHRHIELAGPGWNPKKGEPKKGHKGLREQVTVRYRVRVKARGKAVDARAWGRIYITNKHPHRPAKVVDLNDLIKKRGTDPIEAEVFCNGGKKNGTLGLPIWIPAGRTLTCFWRSPLPDTKNRWNVAAAELQNHHHEIGARPKPTGTTWFKGHARVRFGRPHEVIDEKAVVLDTLASKGFLGFADARRTPKTFRYRVVVKPGGLAPLCGKGTVDNTATVVTKDTETRTQDSVSIPVVVKCPSPKDPPTVDPPKDDPPNDDPPKVDPPKDDPIVCVPGKGKPWHLIGPDGKKSEFFESGHTYKKVMRKGRRGKNPHYRFARAYISAKLYIAAGAKYGKRVERSARWAERYFASHDAKATNVKRALNAKKAKRLRKAIYKKKRVLIRYAKRAKMPSCQVA
ncbi:MAG: hypothetical protein ACR2OD_07365 [Gaiellaceae bacterium]